MEVSQMLALLIRNKGAKIQQAMSETCYNVCTDILSNIAKGGVNDKIIANVSIALAYLSAHSADPKQMEALYSAFDESAETSDPCLISIKWGILTNGNDKLDKTALRASWSRMWLTHRPERSPFGIPVRWSPSPTTSCRLGMRSLPSGPIW